jgi:hypothetical protein
MKYDSKNLVGLKVKLTTDLTKYHRSLVVGHPGITMGGHGLWSKNQPSRFVTIKFKDVILDILWSGLEPL